MSENTNPTAEELIRNVKFTIQRHNTVPMPIDPTLSHEGEAADAKATGEAVAAAVDALSINGKSPVNKAVTLYGTDIAMDNEAGSPTVAQAIEAAAGRDASDIMYDTENLVTVKAAIDGIKTDMDSEISTDDIDDIFDEVFGGDD